MPERVLSIHRGKDHFAITIPKFIEAILKSEDLGGANERESSGNKEEQEPGLLVFIDEVFERDL